MLKTGFRAWYQCLNGYLWTIPPEHSVLERKGAIVITLLEIIDVVFTGRLYCLTQVGDEGLARHD